MVHDPAAHHRANAPATVRCALITVSDTRTLDDDPSGDTIRDRLEAVGHALIRRTLVRDDPEAIAEALEQALAAEAQAVLLTGGTGLTRRDSTYEVVTARIERPIPGFGELFRMLSFEQVGAASMISRATAGVIGGAVVFALPGSRKAVELALDRLIAPELGHVLEQLGR